MIRLTIAALLAGCVTRTQVCVEYAKSIGPRTSMSNDAASASVCADVERP